MAIAKLQETLNTLGPTPEAINETQVQIATRDDSIISVWIVSPRTPPALSCPVIAWFHGGGFCIGDGREESPTARRFALQAGTITICVNYRLAPEHKFPTAVHDGQDALKWVYALFISQRQRGSI
jgi:acetyl esterase